MQPRNLKEVKEERGRNKPIKEEGKKEKKESEYKEIDAQEIRQK